VSFASLKNLKWLDLKNNPLVPAVQQAAGPCITASDCAMCAKKVTKGLFTLYVKENNVARRRATPDNVLRHRATSRDTGQRRATSSNRIFFFLCVNTPFKSFKGLLTTNNDNSRDIEQRRATSSDNDSLVSNRRRATSRDRIFTVCANRPLLTCQK
jgi:hypothetical protein